MSCMVKSLPPLHDIAAMSGISFCIKIRVSKSSQAFLGVRDQYKKDD